MFNFRREEIALEAINKITGSNPTREIQYIHFVLLHLIFETL
jgi:hypothetical protein